METEVVSGVRAVPATEKLVHGLLNRLRSIDHHECYAMSGRNADIALLDAVRLSKEDCYVGMIDDDPILAFGCAPQSLLSFVGVPWMLATDRIVEVKKSFIKNSKPYIESFRRKYGVLENYVHADNIISIQWLHWCGFTIEQPQAIGYNNERFCHFWMRGL